MAEETLKIPESLKKALKAGQVVPFVGAGVSKAIKKINDDGTESTDSLFPTWKEFVETLAQTLRDENKPDDADLVLNFIKLKKPKYLEALQHAYDELTKTLWYETFENSFDKQKSEAVPDSLKLSELVWQLSNNLIITTNIDRALQWTCPQSSDVKALDVQNVAYAQLQKESYPKRPTVWYLHGSIDHVENVIFTRQQFEDFYKKRNNEAKFQTLLNLLTQKTFLFIGFSLDDDYLKEVLEYIHEIYRGGADSYYILFREKDIATANFPKYVTPVPFSDFGKPLEDLIEQLIAIAKESDDSKKKEVAKIDKSSSAYKKEETKPFFNVEYSSKKTEFVGREGKTEEIWNLLNKEGCASIGQAVSVKGFGGLGKTQLAVEYAHGYKNKYPNGVYWLIADQNIDNQLLQIADKKGWINNFDKTVNQLEIAKAKFLQLSECLILFDNVENFADIKDYLPKTDLQTHILITSRERIAEFYPINLELLERDESRELLLKIASREPKDETEKEHLEQILEILGDIPLAVELVGGYLSEHETITFAKYHQFLNEVPLDKLEKEFPEGSYTKHDRSIIQTLRISEKTIKEKPLMVEILKVLAWSGSSSMGVSLLQSLVEPKNEFEFETAIADAHKLRLLKKDEDTEHYTIHRLLAKVICHQKPLNKQKKWHTKIVNRLENWFGKLGYEHNNLAIFETEIEHLDVWQKQTLNLLPTKSIILTKLRATIPYQRGNYQTALDWFLQAFNLYHTKNLDNKDLLANLSNDLGSSYGELGDYQKALEYQEKALVIKKELFKESHHDTATFYNNVGSTYGELGNHLKALEYQEKGLAIRKELFGENHSDTATSYNNIGSIYGGLGDHLKALEYKEKALAIRKELLGENHPNTATSYHNIGFTYGSLGDYKKALEYQQKALEVLKELFGENHPNTAASYNNIGLTYGNLGNHQNALEYQEKALKIQTELLGKEHPKTILFAYNTAINCLKLKNPTKAGRLANEYFKFVPQNHKNWKFFEELSRPYRKKNNPFKKRKK